MKILLECHHGIGDVVMTFPALYNLKELYPDAEITYLGGLQAEIPLIMHTEKVEKCYVHNVKKNTMKDLAMLTLRLRREHFDLGIAMGQSLRGLDVLLLKLAGCRKIVSMKNPNAIFQKYEQVDISMHKHRVEQHMELIKALGGPERIPSETIKIGKEKADEIFRQYQIPEQNDIIGFLLGTGDFFYRDGRRKILYNTKKWDLEKFARLADRLIAEGHTVILLGGEKEKAEFESSSLMFHGKSFCLLGELDILSLISVMKKCKLIVGADTGPMHCAAAEGVPTITLFGPTDASNIGPYGSNSRYLYGDMDCIHCYSETEKRGRDCKEIKCMESISVDQVYEEIEKCLN